MVHWAIGVAIEAGVVKVPNCVQFTSEYMASFLFCTCYTILLYIWGEQWATRRRFPSEPFRHFFFSTTAVVYTLAIACMICECLIDTEVATAHTTDCLNTYREHAFKTHHQHKHEREKR